MGWAGADKDFDLTRPFAMSTLKGAMILGLERGSDGGFRPGDRTQENFQVEREQFLCHTTRAIAGLLQNHFTFLLSSAR